MNMTATVEDRVKNIVVQQLGVSDDEIKLDSSFVDDLGADSLDTVELVMALEEEFDLEIQDDDAERITTIKQAIDFINENKFVESQKTAVQNAVTKLQTEYAADSAGENLRKYAGQIAHDSVMQFHGQFTVKKAKESGLKHFTYTGTLVRDSRPFCVSMVGRTLTEKQIRDR